MLFAFVVAVKVVMLVCFKSLKIFVWFDDVKLIYRLKLEGL